jgi:hypothetical protein
MGDSYLPPNGLRISGAEGVRCMRGLGDWSSWRIENKLSKEDGSV